MGEVTMFRGNASNQMMTKEERDAAVVARSKALRAGGAAYVPFEGGIQYLKIDGNTGTMTYGRDNSEIPAGQQFGVPFDVCEHGLLNWQGGKIIERKMIRVLDGPMPVPPQGEPRVGMLPKPRERDGWAEVISIRLVGIGGEMDRVELEADCSNESKRQQAMNLLGEMHTMADTALGAQGFFNAVIQLGIDSYWHKSYSRDIFFPVFNIVGWTNGTEIRPVGSGSGDGAPGKELLD